LAVRR